MRKKNKPDADVIIVGGGLAGCTLAALLSSQGVQCLIIEERNNTSENSESRLDPRALAITRASQNILHNADAWKYLPKERIGYFREMHVWEENGAGEIHFDSAELCEPVLGHIIEQTVLEQALQRALEDADRINWRRPAIPILLAREEDRITVELEDGRILGTRLIVAADGARSKVRTLAGIANSQHDYNQHAVACVVETEKLHAHIARQRFLRNGPLAFLPMADQKQCGIVWSTSPEHAKVLLAMDEEEFNRALGRAFNYTLGEILSSKLRAGFSLQHAQAAQYCQPRLALVGDAAHTVHPLAGQGANLGLLDAAALAEVVLQARNRNRDIGAHQVLRRYERWRKGENLIMLRILQGIKYLFENKLQTVMRLRNLGLDFTDAATPMKHVIMRYAMGLAGDLPVSARAIA